MAARRKAGTRGAGSGGARKRELAPHVELAELLREVEAEPELRRAYVLRGEERWFKERAIAAIGARGEALGLEVCRHDAVGFPRATELELPRLLDDLAGASLFGAARLVLVRNVEPLLKKSGKDDSALTQAVKAFVARPAPPGGSPGTVVLDGAGLRADAVAVKACVAAGGVVLSARKLWDSPPPWRPGGPLDAELAQWFLARARERGVRLSSDEALYVLTVTGNDLAALDGELENLAATGGGGVRAKIGWTADVSPWAVGDALVAGDVRKALAGLEGLFRGGFKGKDGKRELDATALVSIVAGHLSRKLRQLLAVLEETAGGASLPDAAAAVGAGKGPKGADELRELLAVRDRPRLEAMLAELSELERASRRGVPVDGTDLARLALRWRPRRARRSADSRRGVR